LPSPGNRPKAQAGKESGFRVKRRPGNFLRKTWKNGGRLKAARPGSKEIDRKKGPGKRKKNG
jgi:hypothetical protein